MLCAVPQLQAQTTDVWSATLTVGDGAGTGAHGYAASDANLGLGSRTYGSLNDNDFVVEGTTYVVKSLRWATRGNERLWLQLDNTPDKAERETWTLHVGTETFAFTSATASGNARFYWDGVYEDDKFPDPGATVTVKITKLSTDPAVRVTPTELTLTEGDAAGGSYEVVLATEPSAEVTVTVTVPNGTDVSVNKTSLTFTTMNWSVAQTVTVTAAHDADVVDDTVTISHSSAGGDYEGLTVSSVAVTVDDDEKVKASPTELTLTEGDAAGGMYEVVLGSQPSADVTVTVTVPGGTDVSANKTSLTFTTTNWSASQTVTVTAAHDDDKADDTVTISHSASGGGYDGAEAADVVVTVSDDDLGVTLSTATLTVAESRTTSYTAVLDRAPSGDVTLLVSSNNRKVDVRDDVVRFSTDSLSSRAWNRPQTIRVEAYSDDDAVDLTATISHTVSGGGYDGVVVDDVVVTVEDDDTARVRVQPTTLTVTEGDSRGDCYDVWLETQPTADVTVSVTVPQDADVSVSRSSLPFAMSDWRRRQEVCVTAAHDSDGANDTVTISHSASGGDYDGLSVSDVVVTVTDDDDTAVSVSPMTLTVTEGDTTGGSYEVVLTTVPSADVTVAVSVPQDADVSVNPTSLTFTTTNWSASQTVTVTAAHDADGVDDTVDIGHSASGGGYNNLTATVAVTVDDDDTVVVKAADATVSEGAGNATVTLSLTRLQGDTTVVRGTVTPTAGTAGADDYTAGAVSFTIAGDASSVDVDIPVTDDSVIEGEERFTAVVAVTAPSDGSIVAGDPATVTITDDDAGLLAVELASATVTEGASATFDVTVTLKNAVGEDLTLPAALATTVTPTFESGTGKASPVDMRDSGSKTLTIAAGSSSAAASFRIADDGVFEPAETLSFALSVAAPPTGVTVGTASVDATIANNDDALPRLELWSAVLTVGTLDEGLEHWRGYAVRGASFESTEGIEFGALSDDDFTAGGTARVVRSLRWEPADPQDLWLQLDGTPDKAERDAWTLHVGGELFPFSGAEVNPSGAPGPHMFKWPAAYRNTLQPAGRVAVRITRQGKPTSLLARPPELTVAEGDSGTYELQLTSAPSADVTVALSVPQDADVSVNKTSLTFTTTNWLMTQTVTVTAGQDDDKIDDPVTIAHAASGGGYDNVSVDYAITVEDDDKAEATVSPVTLTLTEGGDSGMYEVVLTAQPSADATVTVLLPRSTTVSVNPSSLTFTTTNWQTPQPVTVSAAHDKDLKDETAVLRHAVSGDGSVVTAATVTVTVEDDDDSDIEARCSAKATARSDPLFGCQWQLENTDPAVLDINVGDVWDAGHLGAGVSVVVVDNGLDPDHPDLVANLDASRHRNFLKGKTGIADPHNHGTGVAGIIAARDNAIGGRGVAPRATMHAHIIIGAGTSLSTEVSGMRDGAETTAVSNNSWGAVPGAGPVTVERLFGMAIDEGLRVGNAGKGTFYVFASGNDATFDLNLDEYTTHHGVTVVGAVDSAGDRSGYSGHGSSLWLSAPVNVASTAPAGQLTDGQVTALAGGGYQFFGFTSSAAPIVSGVAALLRGAYPALTWRDVKLILAGSARKTDATDTGWSSGALQYGSMSDRYDFNREYGFGVVDAKAAFDLAATWTNLPTYVKSSAWQSTDRDIVIPDDESVVTSTVTVGDEVEFIEFVEVNATFNASAFRDLKIELVSPSNTVSLLLPSRAGGGSLNGAFRLGSARHLGEPSKGTWTLRLKDEVTGTTNALTSWNLVFYGHRSTPAAPAIDSVVPGAGALTVSWTLPANTGVSTITRYDLRHIRSNASDKSDANWTVVAAGNPDPLRYTLSSLTAATQYDVQVRAVNAQGGGAWSATSTGTPHGRGVLVMPRVLTVTEGDATGAGYEVALGAAPSADVTVTVTVPGGTDVSVNKSSLTFTTTNWRTTQTVTVTAAHDADKVDDTVTITHGASGGGYDSAPAGDVVVTVEDDDVTGLRATPARLFVTEGASASYDVTLAGRPSADVTVTVTVPGGTDVSVNKDSLTFTTTNWRMPQTVTVTAAHDQDLVPDTVTIAHGASGGGYDGVSLNVVVTVNDDDGSDVEAKCSAKVTARSDPLFGCQWQLENADPAVIDINVGDVWDAGHLGTGVSVRVIDSGLYASHPDLVANVDPGRHWNYNTDNSAITDRPVSHGTGVAGTIAARDNRIGGRGVAPRARIHAYNATRAIPVDVEIADAFARDVARTAVANNSWVLNQAPRTWNTSAIMDRALEEGLRVGNAGNGTFYVFASGNAAQSGDDINLDELRSHHGVTVVGAVDKRGVRASYSTPGSNLWLTAPVGDLADSDKDWALVTWGQRGYDNAFGTSFAAPMVSGVAALLRGAYPALTWRDVKLILAGSARKTDATNTGWRSGALQYGALSDRYEFNREYGFGVVDAKAALDLAATWTNLPAYIKSSAWLSADRDIVIPDDESVVTSTVTVGDEVEFIEFVEVNTEFNALSFRNLRLELVSPSNTVSVLLFSWGGESQLRRAFRLGSARHLGEPSKGTWMLRLKDEVSGMTNTLESWNLVFYGHRSTPAAPAIDSVVPGAGALTVSWTLPANTGVSAITRYDLRHIRSDASDKSDANWTVVAAGNPNPLTYTLSSLTPAAQYDVQVRAVNGQGAGAWSATSTGTAGGSAGPPAATIRAGTSPVTEGTAATFTVELSTAAPSGGLSIALTVADVSGSDFVASGNEGSKTLSFAVGDTSKTYTVATVADTVDEASGNVTVTVGSGTGYTVGTPSSASVTVNDDDSPAATIRAGTSPVTEGTAASFTVELSTAAPSGGLSVALTVADVSGSDFVASANEGAKTLSFAVGDTSKTYTVATVADSVDEASGDVTVTVGSGTGYTVGTASSASVTVNDDDSPAATVKAGTSPVTEGTAASFTVELSTAAPSGGLSVALTVADVSGSDFVASGNEGSKTLSFAVGDTSKTYTVATVADTVDEASGNVTVTVGSGTGYTVGTPSSASVTVNDDDSPAATIRAGTSPVTEGTAASFTVELSTAAPSGGLSVALTVADVSGSDFVASANEGAKTLSFAVGDTSKTYTVATVADTVDEASGAVKVTVGSGTGYTVGTPSSASVTVNDDDSPAATIKAGTSPVTEGTAASFTVELSTAAPTGGLSIALTVADVSGSDFVASGNEGSKTLSFAVGETSKTYTVATVADSVDEASGAVKVTVGTGTGYTVGTPSSASVTVNDDDSPAATIKAGTSPVTEGTAASFTVELSTAAPSGGLSVALTVADVSGSDFVASANEGAKTLSFAVGDTSKTYTVATVADTVDEASGNVTVTVGSGSGYTVGTPSSASVTVNDDDSPVATIKAGTSPVTEGTAASFTVELSTAAPSGGLSIALTVADVSGSDFVASGNEGSKTLSFAVGDTSKTYTVATVADSVDEASGNVTVTVGSGTGYTVGTPSSASVTVNDDDSPAATIRAGTSPVTEGTAASFTVELSTAAPSGGLSISLTVADVSGSDFVASGNEGSKTLSFAEGDTSKTYTVATVADTVDEASGAVKVTVGSGTGYTVGTPSSASVTVNDDDSPAATVKAGTSPVTEGTAASFTVELSTAAPTGGLSISLTVADVSGSDFVASGNEGSKTLSFAVGDTSKTYTVATVADTVDEASGNVTVTVGSGSGYTVGTPSSASVTVNDDDSPAATIKAGTSPVTEGTAASFTVELSTAAPSGGLSVALTVADVSGSDFVASGNEGSKTLSFAVGDTSKTYTVATVADSVDEASGNVTVTVGTGTGYTVGTPSSASVTVNDDDAPAASISAGTSPVTEGTAATFTVELSTAAPSGGLSIALTVADVSGSDFVASSNEGSKTLSFAVGDTSKTYTVATVADTVDEASGAVKVTIGTGTGYTVGTASSASVTVNDDDAPAATVKAGTSPVTEGTAASFTVELSTAAPTGGLSISLTVADVSGSDFVASGNEGSKTLSFAVGDTSKTYTVATVADSVDEASGAVKVTVGTGTGYTVGTPSSASVTVNDDDSPAATVKAGTSPVTEGTAASFTVELSTAAPTGGLSISLTVADVSGSDFVASGNEGSKTLSFAVGDTSKTYTVATVADSVDEASGNVTVTVGTGTGYTVGTPSSASVTVNDDDSPAATVKAGTSPVTEGTAATFTVELSTAAPTGGLSIALTVADVSGSDFVASGNEGSKTLSFAEGDTSKTYTVATVADSVDEASGNVTVTVGSGTGYTVGTASSASVTVNDDDAPAASIKAGTSPVTEGTAASFTVELSSAAPSGGLSISLTVADVSGSDFVASGNEGSKTLSFAEGDTSKTYTVATVADSVDEASGAVQVTIGTGTGYTVGTPSSASVTVNDDDSPAATIKAGTSPVTEGTAASFTVELSTAAPTGGMSISLTVADVSGSDFVASGNEGAKTLSFAEGDTSKTYTVATVADSVDEASGAVKVTVGSGTGYTVGTPSSASVTVNDDDSPAVTIKAGTSPVTEGTAASFTVELSTAAPTGGLSIALTVADVSGSDFVASGNEGSKTLSFAEGDTSKTYTVATVADSVDEASGNVTVTVGSGTGYTVGTPSSASVTVNDDDSPVASIKAGTSPVTEGTAASFTVELSTAAPSGGLSIALTVADVSGSDFVASGNEGSKTLSFAEGDTSKTYTVATVADSVDEASGAIQVTVGSGTGYTVGTASSASVTVNDDDAPAASIKAGTSPVTEGTAASFTVELSSAAPTGGLSISLTVADVSGSDFVASGNEGSKTLSFAVGDTSKTYTVATVADSVDEASGAVKVTVGTGTGYTVGTPSSASVTVNDDDDAGVRVSSPTLSVKAGETATYTLVLDSKPTANVTVTPTSADSDKATVSGAAEFTPGNWNEAKTITVTGVAVGSVRVTHAASSTDTGYLASLSIDPVTVTVNPSTRTYALTSSVTAGEGANAELTVTLGEAAPTGGLALSVAYDYSGGDATAADTGATPSTLTLAVNETTATLTIPLASDDLVEGDETFTASISTSVSGWNVASSGGDSATVTITDDDAPAAKVAFGRDAAGTARYTASVGEEAAGGAVDVPVTVSHLPGASTTFAVEVIGGTAAENTDYQMSRKWVTFGPTDTGRTKNIRVTIIDDPDVEPEETIELRIAAANRPVAALEDHYARDPNGSLATITIRSGDSDDDDDGDDPPPSGPPTDDDEEDDDGDPPPSGPPPSGPPTDDPGGDPPSAAIAVDLECPGAFCRVNAGVVVSFRDASTGPVSSRQWDFGDGATSGSALVEHSWSSPGFYEVVLWVSDGSRESAASWKVLVEADDPTGTCVADVETACYQDSRFAVEIEWWTGDGTNGQGRLVYEGTNDSGLFHFFDPNNWEVLIKVLDGCSVNEHVWVYGASATTLGYEVTVTDTVTGAEQKYRNEAGRLAGAIADNTAFPGVCTASGTLSGARAGGSPPAPSWRRPGGIGNASEDAGCVNTPTTLCLLEGRYEVSVAWSAPSAGGEEAGAEGPGRVLRQRTGDSGLFYFFGPDNWEMLVKVLDGCSFNGHHWVYAAAATDLGLDLVVRDTVTGLSKNYVKEPGKPAGAIADAGAFPEGCQPP